MSAQHIGHSGRTAGGILIRDECVDIFRQGEQVVGISQRHSGNRLADSRQCLGQAQLLRVQMAVVAANDDAGAASCTVYQRGNLLIGWVNGGGPSPPRCAAIIVGKLCATSSTTLPTRPVR